MPPLKFQIWKVCQEVNVASYHVPPQYRRGACRSTESRTQREAGQCAQRCIATQGGVFIGAEQRLRAWGRHRGQMPRCRGLLQVLLALVILSAIVCLLVDPARGELTHKAVGV